MFSVDDKYLPLYRHTPIGDLVCFDCTFQYPQVFTDDKAQHHKIAWIVTRSAPKVFNGRNLDDFFMTSSVLQGTLSAEHRPENKSPKDFEPETKVQKLDLILGTWSPKDPLSGKTLELISHARQKSKNTEQYRSPHVLLAAEFGTQIATLPGSFTISMLKLNLNLKTRNTSLAKTYSSEVQTTWERRKNLVSA